MIGRDSGRSVQGSGNGLYQTHLGPQSSPNAPFSGGPASGQFLGALLAVVQAINAQTAEISACCTALVSAIELIPAVPGTGAIPTQFINNNTGAPLTVTLPPAHTSVTMKDSVGNAALHTITFVDGGGALIDGQASAHMIQNYAALTFAWNSTLGQWNII